MHRVDGVVGKIAMCNVERTRVVAVLTGVYAIGLFFDTAY